MKHALRLFAVLVALAVPAMGQAQSGGCYADYKAQRTQGGALQLHYGVIQLNARACQDRAAADRQVGRRIAAEGWQLLRVLSTFDGSGLNQRQANAGQYFLRY